MTRPDNPSIMDGPGGDTPTIKNLHAVRGIAAAIVVVYHAKFALWIGGSEFVKLFPLKTPEDYILFSIDILSSCGKQCVVVFFLLSALVIKYSFEKNQLSVTRFYVIRAIRIYIPYIASLVLSGLVLYAVGHYFHLETFADVGREFNHRLQVAYANLGAISFIKALIFLPDQEYFGFNPAYWSLLHEGVFYFLFPLYTRLKPGVMLALIPVLATLYFITGSMVMYFQVFFLAGLLIYELLIRQNRRWTVQPVLFWPVLIILYGLINFTVQVTVEAVADALTVLLYAWTVNYLLQRKSVMGIFSMLGDVSYTLYLFHLPILILCYAVVSRLVPGMPLMDRMYYYYGVVVSLWISYPLYLMIEKRSLVVLSNLKSKYGVH